MPITIEMLKEYLEENCIREAALYSPSLGEWMKRQIEEHGSNMQLISNLLGEMKSFIDKEIAFYDESVAKNGL
ncbi:hypothetical protein PP935_gp159 [Rhizobium phage RHph_N34]|uniref:Uncharacterized protein n=1 Tax=Rhizobium phage RHph_N34 TaxID=2509586 RepID=A0A7S5RK34_9CAUD|nr:hypothetical protein PP935_gp159 [Rhizobium phage RHph_N34]QIG73934.1 hypothetical protein EVC06_159 [Rhizobium phage RHph_N34]